MDYIKREYEYIEYLKERREEAIKTVKKEINSSEIKEYLEEVGYGEKGYLLYKDRTMYIKRYGESEPRIESKEEEYEEEIRNMGRIIANHKGENWNIKSWWLEIVVEDGLRLMFTYPEDESGGVMLVVSKVKRREEDYLTDKEIYERKIEREIEDSFLGKYIEDEKLGIKHLDYDGYSLNVLDKRDNYYTIKNEKQIDKKVKELRGNIEKILKEDDYIGDDIEVRVRKYRLIISKKEARLGSKVSLQIRD